MRVVARDAPGVFLSRLAHHFVKLMLGSCGSKSSNLVTARAAWPFAATASDTGPFGKG